MIPSQPTILRTDGEEDEGRQRTEVRFCIENGAQGLACLLFSGECYKFTDAERKRVLRIVVDEAGGEVPVLAGISHSGTIPSVELGRDAVEAGADGVVVTPPYHVSFVEEASCSLFRHYAEIGDKVDLPVMIQDYKTTEGVDLAAPAVEALRRSSPRVRYLKVEGLNHLERIADARKVSRGKLGIFAGMAGRHMVDKKRLGATGAKPRAEMTAVLVRTYEACAEGRFDLAAEVHQAAAPYLDFLVEHFVSFTSTQKETLKAMGVIRDAAVRQPAVPLEKGDLKRLLSLLKGMGLIAVSR